MSDGAILGMVITICLAAVGTTVALAILLYHQMLLINEVNRRLMDFSAASIDGERIALADLKSHLIDTKEDDDDAPFLPHQHDIREVDNEI